MNLRRFLIKIGAVIIALGSGLGLRLLLLKLRVDKEITSLVALLGGLVIAFLVYAGLEDLSSDLLRGRQ